MTQKEKMNLLILAAGFATRLEPRTLETPKQLLPLRDDYYLLDLFWENIGKAASLFERKIIVTNEKYYQKFVDWNEKRGLSFEIISDGVKDKTEKIGAVGDFLHAVDKAEIKDDVLVCASDYIMPKLDVEAIINLAKSKDASATITKEEPLEEIKSGSCLLLDSESKILKFEEKPQEPFSNLYGVPYYLIKKNDFDLIRQIPSELRDNSGQMIAQLVASSKVYALKYEGDVIHMTTETDYQELIKQISS
jgi:NDP-sugar pyrophosphorylase family protein